MPTTTIPITNPRLALTAHSFRSITERRDLPRKLDCLPAEANGVYGTELDYACQEGCGEKGFMYIVEPGDKIPLQFHAPDTYNADPEHPAYGWREAGGSYMVELQVMAMDGTTVLWSGNTNAISEAFLVGYLDRSFQNITVDVDRLLALIPGTSCWYFRAKVYTAYEAINSANSDSEPVGAVPIGYTYIDVPGGQVLEWNGSTWEEVDLRDGDVWYSTATNIWYQWDNGLDQWQTLSEAPEPEVAGDAFDYLVTMGYRLARCNEYVVRFRSVDNGTDCDGWIHGIGPGVVGPRIFTSWYIGSWDMGLNQPPYGTEGVVVLNEYDGRPYTLTGGVWVQGAAPTDGSIWVVSFFTITSFNIMAYRSAGSPYWETVTGDSLASFSPFQHDFRVLGSAEVDGMPLQREVTKNGRLVSRVSERNLRVRTAGIPAQVAERVRAVLAAKEFYIDEEAYTESDGFRKNNDEGLMWHLDFNVGREDCNADASCD